MDHATFYVDGWGLTKRIARKDCGGMRIYNPIFIYLGLFRKYGTLYSKYTSHARDFNWVNGYGSYVLFCRKDTCCNLLIPMCLVEVIVLPSPKCWYSWSSILYFWVFSCWVHYLGVFNFLIGHWSMHYKHKETKVIQFLF